jgi:hypothetical protein
MKPGPSQRDTDFWRDLGTRVLPVLDFDIRILERVPGPEISHANARDRALHAVRGGFSASVSLFGLPELAFGFPERRGMGCANGTARQPFSTEIARWRKNLRLGGIPGWDVVWAGPRGQGHLQDAVRGGQESLRRVWKQ